MRNHASLVVTFLCVSLAALSSYGCSDDDGVETAIGPSRPDGGAGFRSMMVSAPTDVVAQPVFDALCPVVPPFVAPVNLVIRADGASDVELREIQMQFVDSAGVRGGVRTIVGNTLGSSLIPAFGTRAIAVSLPFGCDTRQTGVMTVVVVGTDSSRRESRTSLQLNVR